MNKVIVIGGGAAGMMAAEAAAKAGAAVTLYEKNEKLGKKLYITGKGRCNVTNACSREDFFDHVVSNPRFLYSAYDAWSNWDMTDFLESEGLELKTERGNRVFPASDKSSDVIRTLQRALEAAGVRYLLNTEVRDLWLEPAPQESSDQLPEAKPGKKKKKQVYRYTCRGIVLADGRKISADRVILATGGLSYPSTGSTGDGYRFAEAAGHSVTDCCPALVPFDAVIGENIPCKELQGLALKNVGMQIFDGDKRLAGEFGELLFTHFGVSGPVVLHASSMVTAICRGKDKRLSMRIDLKPALTEEQLDARLQRELSAGANKQIKNLAGALYPSKLIPVILKLSGISPDKCGREVTREERMSLLRVTKAFPVKLLGTRSYMEAIITQGGISVKEVDPKTMESRITKGLYLAGEVMDLDAFTGGYNLQIAWSTGYAAGTAAAASQP